MCCTWWLTLFLIGGGLTSCSSLGQVIEDQLEPEKNCYLGEFQCKNGNCIKMKYVCNNVSDCLDESDEPHNCNVDRCLEDGSHRCSHKCVNTSNGFECACNKGYKLLADEKSCEDVNECIEMPAVCSQKCWNTHGSYNCKCDERFYRREPDGHTCKRITVQQAWVLFSNNRSIEKMATDGSEQELIDESMGFVVGLDFHHKEDMIYYSDIETETIYRAKANGSDKEEVIVNQTDALAGLSVDWVGNKIYWLAESREELSVAELNGTNHKILKNDGLSSPRGLAVHPGIGYAYFTNWLEHVYIGRIGMDGSNFSHVFGNQDRLQWPNALNIDFFADRIYWADAGLDYIAYSDFDGKNHHEVLRDSKVPHVFAITVFDDYMYWTDWRLKAIVKANKLTGENLQILQNTTKQPFAIKIYHPLRQLPFKNPCGDSNGGCSHLCLLSPKDDGIVGYTCACPSELYLESDNKTCVAHCTEQQFHCAGGDKKCFPIHLRCDGVKHCADGSDEPPLQTCREHECSHGHFQCEDGKTCALPTQLCDGQNDCADGSDEKYCHLECAEMKFKCKSSGECIFSAWVCDGDRDCRDGSDEEEDCAETLEGSQKS